jgi:hypothetical protein
MGKPTYQIISTIYRLLGDYDSRQLREASRQKNLPKALRFALQKLADEAEAGNRGRIDRPVPVPTTTRIKRREPQRNGHGQAPSLSPHLPKDIYKQNLSEFLRSRSRFANKSELLEFAAKVGFSGKVGAKDSRTRVEQKIVSFALSNSNFRDSLDRVVPNDWSKQTSGWLDLILSSRK